MNAEMPTEMIKSRIQTRTTDPLRAARGLGWFSGAGLSSIRFILKDDEKSRMAAQSAPEVAKYKARYNGVCCRLFWAELTEIAGSAYIAALRIGQGVSTASHIWADDAAA